MYNDMAAEKAKLATKYEYVANKGLAPDKGERKSTRLRLTQ